MQRISDAAYTDRAVTEKCEDSMRMEVFEGGNPVRRASEQHIAAVTLYNTYSWRCECYSSLTVRVISPSRTK
jgi:hypothetical protein